METIYRPFNRDLIERGIVEDFLATLGLDEAAVGAMTISPPRNISPGPKTVAALIELGRRMKLHGLDPDKSGRREVRRTVVKLGNRLGWNESALSGIAAAQAELIRKRFASGNKVLASKVWGKRWEDIFGADCWTPLPYNAFHRQTAASQEAREFDAVVERVWPFLRDGKTDKLAAATDVPSPTLPARRLIRRFRAFSAGLRTR